MGKNSRSKRSTRHYSFSLFWSKNDKFGIKWQEMKIVIL
nr:MAG TPA: hypothetical protein [Caudoviricetes sp.]